jgi:hypothetical protein
MALNFVTIRFFTVIRQTVACPLAKIVSAFEMSNSLQRRIHPTEYWRRTGVFGMRKYQSECQVTVETPRWLNRARGVVARPEGAE